jgi:hypothetical protein
MAKTILAGLMAMICSGMVAQAKPAGPMPVYYRVVLDRGVTYPERPEDARDLMLDLEQIGDQWGAVYGVARNYNMPFHKGAVSDAKVSGDTITLKIGMDIQSDKWIPGGQGVYEIALKRQADGKWTGPFTGKFKDIPVKGQATATTYAPQRASDFLPIAPQEHPRLLFRKHELEKLRAKAKTPFGQAAMKKLEANGTPASFGLLYQLTGDKQWAEKAVTEAEEYLAGRKPPGDPFVPKRPLWGQLEQLALVYDLCYDALPSDFKSRYRAWIADLAFQLYFATEALGVTNWHVVSNHVANVYAGVLMAALALFDEPAPAPQEPTPPFLDDVLPPAKDFVAAPGVPVVPLTPGKSPTEWLHSEPLRQATPDDPRDVFYGLEKLRPTPGTTVKVGDFTVTLDKMDEKNRSTDNIGGLAVGHLIEADAKAKAKEPFTMVAYTVVDVKEPGQFVVQNPVSRANLAQLSLNGQLLANGQVVRLEKGLYPLMVMVQWRMKWGHIAPMLQAATEQHVAEWKQKSEQIGQGYETKRSSFAQLKAEWERTGGGDPAFARLLRLARFTGALHCTDAVGRGGFQGEVGGYSVDAMSGFAKAWPMYRRVMGFDLSPGEEYPSVIPRKLVGGPQDINGTTAIPDEMFPALFASIRPEWQPEILTAWHNELKVTGPGDIANVLNADPVRAFLSYPLDMRPAPIGTKLPLVWEAPDFGYYAFRSGWDDHAFIAQVFLKSQVIKGWNGPNAGTYRLRGLGQNWATGPTDRVRRREQENVVWCPEINLDEGARGHLTHFEANDKTCVLSANLDEVYEHDGLYSLSSYGHLRRANMPPKDGHLPALSGMTGARSIAFDYSGLSGAPCLFAVVDKIIGGAGQKRLWLFQPPLSATPATGKKTGPSPISQIVKPGDRGFTVQPPGVTGSLRGVFAHPAAPTVNTEPLSFTYTKTWGQQRGQVITVKVDAMSVPGEDNFFFVGTVATGEHPPVQVQGSGLDAVVTVGKRTVRFDGQKIVLGKK